MRKIIAYPFSNEVVNIVNIIKEEYDNTEIILSIPRGWHYVDDMSEIDASESTWGEKIGCKMTNLFEEKLDEVDEVIIFDTDSRSKIYDDYISKIIASIKTKKIINCFATLGKKDIDLLSDMASKNHVFFKSRSNETNFNDEKNYKLRTIETPIVGIGNLVSDRSNYDIISLLAYLFQKMGYSPAIISTNNNLHILDNILVYTLEKIDTYSSKNILEINNVLKNIEQKRNVDVFMIDIPGAMMKYSNTVFNNFALGAYCFSQAVDFDYFILNSVVGNYGVDFYCSLSKCFETRYGMEIDAVFVGNKVIDMAESVERQEIILNKVPYRYVDEYIHEINEGNERIEIINSSISGRYKAVVKKIIEQLSSDMMIV